MTTVNNTIVKAWLLNARREDALIARLVETYEARFPHVSEEQHQAFLKLVRAAVLFGAKQGVRAEVATRIERVKARKQLPDQREAEQNLAKQAIAEKVPLGSFGYRIGSRKSTKGRVVGYSPRGVLVRATLGGEQICVPVEQFVVTIPAEKGEQ